MIAHDSKIAAGDFGRKEIDFDKMERVINEDLLKPHKFIDVDEQPTSYTRPVKMVHPSAFKGIKF